MSPEELAEVERTLDRRERRWSANVTDHCVCHVLGREGCSQHSYAALTTRADTAEAALAESTGREAALRAALEDAFNAMDAACRWASGETAGIRTIADADRHMAGFDALVAATARAQAARIALQETPPVSYNTQLPSNVSKVKDKP